MIGVPTISASNRPRPNAASPFDPAAATITAATHRTAPSAPTMGTSRVGCGPAPVPVRCTALPVRRRLGRGRNGFRRSIAAILSAHPMLARPDDSTGLRRAGATAAAHWARERFAHDALRGCRRVASVDCRRRCLVRRGG